MYMFPPFPLLNKVIQRLRSTQEGDVILIAPMWLSQPWFPHPLRLCLDHPRSIPYAWTYCHNKSYHLHAWRLSCSTTKQQDFQKRSLGSRQLLEDPQQTGCMTTGGFALHTRSPDKTLIHLV